MAKIKRLLMFMLAGLMYMQAVNACPTCIGRLELQSPTFFSEELYQLDPEDDVTELRSDKQAGKAKAEMAGKSAAEDDEDD